MMNNNDNQVFAIIRYDGEGWAEMNNNLSFHTAKEILDKSLRETNLYHHAPEDMLLAAYKNKGEIADYRELKIMVYAQV